jgi:Mg-chelatase subunit ChlD
MRQFMSLALALCTLFLGGASLATLTPAVASGQLAVPQQNESSCSSEHHKVAFPDILLLGETTTITLTVHADCASELFPLHIVFVLDASGSMEGQPTRQMKNAVTNVIEDLDLANNPTTKVGVVQFNDKAQTLCQLTNNTNRLRGCVNQVAADGGTAIDAGVTEGLKVLYRGRSEVEDKASLQEVMVVVSDGENNNRCGPVLDAARQAKATALVATVCVGAACDAQCMRQAATSARYFFTANNANGLTEVLNKIRADILNITLRRLTVADTLPANMAYVPDSAEPEPDRIGPNGDELEWQLNHVPKDGVTITFRVKPLEVGYHPTNIVAFGEFLDNKNRKGEFVYEVPHVTVLQPFPMVTPTGLPPTPTFTPPPTPTHTPTGAPPTAPPPPTPTPRPGPIYLPLVITESCTKTYIYSDVALVLDMSTSMNRRTPSGQRKLDAALSAAAQFVGDMDFSPDATGQHDQVAVVGFNDSAWIEQTLTNDEAAALSALGRLRQRQQEGTRLDLAFRKGAEALPAALRLPNNTPVIVFLTDGLPNRVPVAEDGRMETTVIRAAQSAKDKGIRLYTIGLGRPDAPNLIDRVDPVLLAACATDPTMFYLDPTGDQLGRVYSEISYSFGCHPSEFWGGR